ncbi:MAG: BLUF domain-containing protein [Gammaproteobacteria bacterium]|nr:BLUF domain-containing protein [Gammaproteobacteria bacterium]
MRIIHLIYISSATSWPSENDLKELLQQSRARNLRQNITGMLLYDNATYMQVLEGSKEDVHEIYNSILKDSRNNGNVTLVEEEISKRNFPNWSMGFKNLKSCSPEELPGFQDVFNGKLDKELAVKSTTKAIALLMGFAKKAL